MQIQIKRQETIGIKDISVTTVALVQDNTHYKIFHCHVCRTPLFQYRGRLISLIPGEAPVELPVIVQCHNRNCDQKYLISTILQRDY